MILTAAAMREAEREAFASGVAAADLMEDAAAGIARFILSELPGPGIAQVFAGKGNNGGDALAAGAILKQHGWTVAAVLPFGPEAFSPLARRQWERFSALPAAGAEPAPGAPRVVLDGLLGTGAAGGPRGPLRGAVAQINRLRRAEGCRVLAVDLPSGLGAEPGPPEAVVTADWTVALGAVKAELLADHATRHAGRLVLVPLPALAPFLAPRQMPGCAAATAAGLRALLPRREFDLHKGSAGRVAVIAGSPGMTGAAVLAGLGALRGGAGLVTLLAPEEALGIVRAAAPPELMVIPLESGLPQLAETGRFHAFAFGPGLGAYAAGALDAVLGSPLPGVIDADGLNAMAARPSESFFPGPCGPPRLLTPHPGEFARLFPAAAGLSRAEAARRFAEANPGAVLLLKGARTIAAARDRGLSFNTTGQPGMATAGLGDVLSGLCAALLARGLGAWDTARLGAWLSGRAAETAMREDHLDEPLTASDVLARLGRAFESLRLGWP